MIENEGRADKPHRLKVRNSEKKKKFFMSGKRGVSQEVGWQEKRLTAFLPSGSV